MTYGAPPFNHEGTKDTKQSLYRTYFLRLRGLRVFVVTAAVLTGTTLRAHSGPPFPLVSDRSAGAYQVSVWADPDATDDRSAAGQFWVMLQPVAPGGSIPPGTRVDVAIRPLDRQSEEQSGRAEPINADAARQFVALVMDHEGPFGVRVAIDGPLGPAEVDASTEATYDLRPRPILMVVFVMPFLVVGVLWGKLLIRRRMHTRGGK